MVETVTISTSRISVLRERYAGLVARHTASITLNVTNLRMISYAVNCKGPYSPDYDDSREGKLEG